MTHIGEVYGCYTIIGINQEKAADGHKIYQVECNECHQIFSKQLSQIKYNIVGHCPHIKDEISIKFCLYCGKQLIDKTTQGNKDFEKQKFCSHSCSAKYYNQLREKKKITPRYCLNCGEEILTKNLNNYSYQKRKYCSLTCEQEDIYKKKIAEWQSGIWDGLIGHAWIDISKYIRRYLFEKYDYKCSRCGWSEINPYTNTLPLEVEHIDGDATNNKEENLTLLCPNCHSLTKTYRGANKGNGNRNIKWLSRDGKTTNI